MLGEIMDCTVDQKSVKETGTPFLLKSKVKFPYGWDAVEVYPVLDLNYWKREFAAVWAETDLLAAVARRHLEEQGLQGLDPHASARKRFGEILEAFDSLLNGPEAPAHAFLKEHPELVSPTHTRFWSKLPLGKRETDLVFREPINDYLLVELERPSLELFRTDGQPREELIHAINQVVDWQSYLHDNLAMNAPLPNQPDSSALSRARRMDEGASAGGETVEHAPPQETERAAELTVSYQPAPESVSTAPGHPAPANRMHWPVIPGYEILDEVGKGGMGMVYRARQLSANRVVALKVIRRDRLEGLAPEQRRDWLQRFQTEAQAAARVSHEHAVTVYEVGEIDGQPFYSMRYVEGRSLAQVLRDGLLANHQAAAHVEQVARAIHSVHLCGILHRDIKPGNILVDQNDRPLVTDFGLAKWVEGGPSREQTRGGLGTPEYMSPEQAWDSARATAASDIYSLGATLYASLTGRPPFQAAEPLETMRQVVDKDPVPLRQLNPAIARDLETIALKCLQKEPGKRYQSALALAEDLRRYREGQPILARPVGPLERTVKWLRRNKALAAFLLAALSLMVGVTAAAFWYQHYLGETAHRQLLNEQTVRHSLDQAQSVHKQLMDDLKKPGGVQELLNQRARYAAQIQLARANWQHARDLADQADASLEPELIDRLQKLDTQLTSAQAEYDLAVRLEKIRMDQAAWVERRFDYKTAGKEYPKAFAAAGLEVVSGSRDAVAERILSMPIKEEVVAALDDWAVVAFRLNNEDLVEKLLAMARAVAHDRGWGDRLRQLRTWRSQEALTALAKTAPATGLSPQLMAMLGVLLAPENPAKESWLRQAQARSPADFWLNFDLAYTLREGDAVEAAGFYRVAIALRTESSAAYNNLGIALQEQKKLPEAIAAYHKAIALDPKLANAYNNLGSALFTQRKLPEAIAAQRQAIALDPGSALAYNGLGSALAQQKKVPEAIAAFRRAIHLDPNYATAYANLGGALYEQRELSKAGAAYQKVIDLNPKSATGYAGLGFVLHAQGKPVEAIAACRKAIIVDPKDPLPYNNLGNVLHTQGKLPDAIAAYRKAIDLDPNYAMAYSNLGAALRAQHKLPEAIAAFQKAVALDPTRAATHYNLGNALRDQQRLPEAVAAYHKAIEINTLLAEAHCNLGHVLVDQGEIAQGLAALRRGDDLGRRRADWTDPSAEWVRNAERLTKLEANLPAILSGNQRPANAGEIIQYAEVCNLKKLYASAAGLYEQALAAERKLANDPRTGTRYNAACAACLCGAGQGKDSAKLDDRQRASWRRQAVTWLNADLALWAKQLEGAKPSDRTAVQQALNHWQEDSDLAGIREAAALARLPAAEQSACRKLWADVGALLKKAARMP